MFVRREPGLTREEVGQVVDAAVSAFRDQADLAVADVRPGVVKAWLEEPAQLAAKLEGGATIVDQALARGDLAGMGESAHSYSQSVLGKRFEPDSLDERRCGPS